MTAGAREDDRALLRRGDPQAFAAFYDRHAARMFAAARALTGSRADAEDAVQETFLNLFQSRERFTRAESLRAYAFATLRHAAAGTRPRRRHEALAAEPAAGESAQKETEERDPALARALERLASEQREVLALKLHGELTFAEIGAALGVPANTAASRYRYALEHLERDLGGSR